MLPLHWDLVAKCGCAAGLHVKVPEQLHAHSFPAWCPRVLQTLTIMHSEKYILNCGTLL